MFDILIPDQLLRYNNDIHFHIQVEQGLTFLCMADATFAKRRAYAFLVDIRGLFLSTFGDSWQHAIAHAMNAQFAKKLADRAVRTNSRSLLFKNLALFHRRSELG